MRLYDNEDIIFYDEIEASIIKTIVNLGPHQSFPIISFGFFESIELDVILLTSLTVSSSQTSCITLAPKVGNLKLDSSENYDDE